MYKNKTDSYKENIEVVKKIVNEIDPVGLIEGGSPLDEYDAEVASIVSLFQKKENKDLLYFQNQIQAIFEKSFGLNIKYDTKKFNEMAQRLILLYKALDA